MAYEQPKYQILKQYQRFELRQYQPYIVAETTLTGNFETVGNQAFRILAGYISGQNRNRTKIAMTVPVNQKPAQTQTGQSGNESVPAPTSAKTGEFTFSFMMPSHFTLDSLPEPESNLISFRAVNAHIAAARIYSGTWSLERYQQNEAELLQAIRHEGFKAVGAPVFARYNSPFTLWFLRKNEVLVEVEQTESA